MQKSVKIRKRMKVIEMIHVPFFAILFFHNLGFQKDIQSDARMIKCYSLNLQDTFRYVY